MINKKVVTQFLNRELTNNDWLKDLRRPALLKEVGEETRLMPGFDKLWVHQLVCFLLVSTLKRFMLHVDMGGGKTNITLFSILHRKLLGLKPKAVVFVPFISAVDTWIEECKTRTPQLKLVPLIHSGIQNLRLLEEGDADVYVVCYQTAVSMLAEEMPSAKRKKKTWTIDPKVTRKVFKGFDTFVADEIHKCSNISTLIYRMCRAISNQCEYGIGLSGTPFGKDVEDVWSQFYLIDFGETLGETKGLFQEAFFTKSLNHFSGFPEYKFDKKKMPLLNRMIKHSSIHYSAKEMHDLPKRNWKKRKLMLPTAMEGYVSRAAAEFIAAIKKGGTREAEASYLQLRQLASGFMTVDGSDSQKVKVSFDNNPKLDLLEEYLDALPLGCKIVVFHHFVYTNHLISERLKKLKIKHARIWSGQRNVIGELQRFRDDQNCTVMVLNDQSGSSSLNLQHANYEFWFEQPDSPINRQQGERRIWRPGQTKPVFYIDPLMDGTADERIYQANRHGKNLLQEFLSGREKF
jgi:SNF2 family DNA or RNA helicase